MKLTISLPILSSIFFLGFNLTVSAQTKTSVILYNSEPYLAEFTTNGDILNLIEKKPNYLKGYVVKPTNNIAQVVATDDSNVSSSGATDLSGEAIGKDRKFIDFQSNYATLDNMSMSRLNAVKDYLENNVFAKVMITSHKIDESDKSEKLSNNRLNSCQKYLELNGIDASRIIVNSVYAPSLENKAAITYIR